MVDAEDLLFLHLCLHHQSLLLIGEVLKENRIISMCALREREREGGREGGRERERERCYEVGRV